MRFTAAVATVAVVAVMAGLVILAVPVRSPLQDCGTSFAFLLNGRIDLYGDPANPPKGATRADVEATNAKPCRPRVADRAKPAAVLIIGGLLIALAAALVEVVARWGDRRRRRPTALAEPAAPGP